MKLFSYFAAAGLILILMIVSLVTFSSCSQTIGYAGTNIGNHISGTYQLFNGTKEKTISMEAGQTFEFTYNSTVEKGSLTITVENPDNKKVANLKAGVSASEEVNAEKSGNYHLIIKGDDTKGSFDVSWEIK